MLLYAKDKLLLSDLKARLTFRKIPFKAIALILGLTFSSIILAQLLSIPLGYSWKQFHVSDGCGDAFGEALSRAGIPVMRCRVPEGIRVPEQDALRLWYDLPDSGEEYDPDGRETTADARFAGEECRKRAAESENRCGSADERVSVRKKKGAPAATQIGRASCRERV